MTEEIDETLPDTVKQFLRAGAKLENITLHANGKWTHEGLDFENPRVIQAFFRGVQRTEGGTWVICLEPFTYPIEVEDVGHFVHRARWDSDSIHLWLTDGSEEDVRLDGFSFVEPDRLYVEVKGGSFQARILKPAYYTILERAEESRGVIKLQLGEQVLLLSDISHRS